MLKAEDFPIAAADERRLDRRRFCVVAGGAALLVATGEWAAARREAGATAPIEVALPDQMTLTAGDAIAVESENGADVLVVKRATGDVVAYDRRCPHLGCPVIWAAARDRFECPCHHAAFEAATGRVLFGPPRRGLTPAIVRSV